MFCPAPFRKQFGGRATINRGLQRLLEGGLVGKIYQETIVKMRLDLSEEEKENIAKRKKERGLHPLNMKELSPPFILLAFLSSVAFLFFTAEWICGHCIKNGLIIAGEEYHQGGAKPSRREVVKHVVKEDGWVWHEYINVNPI